MKYSTALRLVLLVGWSTEQINSFNLFGVFSKGRGKSFFGKKYSTSQSATPHPPDKSPSGEVFQAQDTYFATPVPSSSKVDNYFATPVPSSSKDDSEENLEKDSEHVEDTVDISVASAAEEETDTLAPVPVPVEPKDSEHVEDTVDISVASAAEEETDTPAPVPVPVEPWLSEERIEELNAAASKFVSDVWSPLFAKEIQRGVPGDTIKGAALAGASLAFLASQGMVVTSAAGLSAAYVAISQGTAGDVARAVGGVAWDVTETATKLYDMATSNNDRLAGLSKELADQVVRAVKALESRAAALQEVETSTDSTTAELEEASEALVESQGELARVLAEAEEAIEAADEAIAKENLTRLADADLEMVTEEEMQALRLAEEKAVRLTEENETRRKADEEKIAAEEEAARLVAEQEAEEQRLREELRQAEEEVRLKEEETRTASDAEVEEEEESDDDDWLEAVAMAQEGLDGKIVGLDEAITDYSAKADWDAAGILAEELRMGGAEEDEDDEELDLEALGKAARAAVESFEAEMGLIGEFSTEEDSDYSDLDAADEMLPEGDLDDIALAARRAVETFNSFDEAEEEDDDSDMEAVDGLLPDGDLEAIAEAARQAVSTFGADEDEDRDEDEDSEDDRFEGFEEGGFVVSDSSVNTQSSSQSPFSCDWSSLTVNVLKAELRSRGLKAYGKKAELVSLLEAYELEQFGRVDSNSETDENEETEASSDTDDDLLDIDDFDLEELGRQARAAVELADSAVLVDEPSDEALKQLESEESILLQMSEPVEAKAIDYSSMTVTQLKDELRSRGLKVSGKKAELIERLESA